MKWVACAESAVEIFANGQVRLSGRATTCQSPCQGTGRWHVAGMNEILLLKRTPTPDRRWARSPPTMCTT